MRHREITVNCQQTVSWRHPFCELLLIRASVRSSLRLSPIPLQHPEDRTARRRVPEGAGQLVCRRPGVADRTEEVPTCGVCSDPVEPARPPVERPALARLTLRCGA